MKPTHQELVRQVGQLAKENHLWKVVLTRFLERTPDVTEHLDAQEWFDFYFLELDKPHGGIVLVRHTVQQTDGEPLVSPAVYYLDDLDGELRQQPMGQTFWKLMAAPVRAAKLERERLMEAAHVAC